MKVSSDKTKDKDLTKIICDIRVGDNCSVNNILCDNYLTKYEHTLSDCPLRKYYEQIKGDRHGNKNY